MSHTEVTDENSFDKAGDLLCHPYAKSLLRSLHLTSAKTIILLSSTHFISYASRKGSLRYDLVFQSVHSSAVKILSLTETRNY